MDQVEPPPARRRKLEAEAAGGAGGIFDDLHAWFWDSPIEQNGSATAATSSPSGETFYSSHNQDGYTANADAAGPLHEMPQFTSREEMLEFQSLTGEEIIAGEADVLGMTAERASASNEYEGLFVASLDAEIALIPDADKQAYVEAMHMCPELIDVEHKKSFVWREGYNAKLAATRLVRYWEERRSLFGQDKFYLPLTLRGALRDDVVAVRNCVLSILPEKDSKGRTVLFWNPSNYDSGLCSNQSMLRACWLVVNTLALDPVSQRRGFVVLLSPSRPSRSKMEFAKNLWRLEATDTPIICRGIHFCKPGPLFHLLNPILKFILGKRLRGRLKVHYGTNEEVLKSLKEYGIQRGNIPKQLGGDLVLDQDQWLADHLGDDRSAGITSVPGVASAYMSSCSISNSVNDPFSLPIEVKIGARYVPSNAEAQTSMSDQQSCKTDSFGIIGALPVELLRMQQDLSTPGESPSYKDSAAASTATSTEENLVGSETLLKEGADKPKRPGRKGDPRMNRAVVAKLENPELSVTEALLEGGFEFPGMTQPCFTDDTLFDTDNISLLQRKNQFRRRMRDGKRKRGAQSKQNVSTSAEKDKTSVDALREEPKSKIHTGAVASTNLVEMHEVGDSVRHGQHDVMMDESDDLFIHYIGGGMAGMAHRKDS